MKTKAKTKQNRTKIVSTRLTPEEWEALAEKAWAMERTTGQLLQIIVRDYLASTTKKSLK